MAITILTVPLIRNRTTAKGSGTGTVSHTSQPPFVLFRSIPSGIICPGIPHLEAAEGEDRMRLSTFDKARVIALACTAVK
jgi:hypothetical protein